MGRADKEANGRRVSSRQIAFERFAGSISMASASINRSASVVFTAVPIVQ